MKYQFLLLILLLPCAYAIIFVPPAIYVVTLSISAFLTNAFLFVIVWMAVSGLLDRRFFGKRPHEIAKVALSFIGRVAVFLFCSIASVLLLNPITPQGTIRTAVASGALALGIYFLSSFREIIVADWKKKIRTIFVCSILTVGGTYASIVLAQETKIIYSKEQYGGFTNEYEKMDGVAALIDKKEDVVEKPVVPQGRGVLKGEGSCKGVYAIK